MKRICLLGLPAAVMGVLSAVCAAGAQEQADELAKQLSNPIASLISVPLQGNFEWGGGVDGDGFAYTMNIQPVIPISISDDWNLISRTILPIAYRDYLPPPDGNTFGLGDITQSLFFSPKAPGPGGLIWGVGPVFLLPTATDDFLGTGKFGTGPTAVALTQTGPWTMGVWAEPFVKLRLAKFFNLRTDPYEFADITSNEYYKWLLYHAYILYGAMTIAQKFADTFKQFPIIQKPNTFGIDDAIRAMQDTVGGAGH